MFLLFMNLYYAMFTGSWTNYTWPSWANNFTQIGNSLGKLLTSIFNDGVTYETFGAEFMANQWNYLGLISLILATITSIGIVVMAVKGIKRVFGVFFMGIRR